MSIEDPVGPLQAWRYVLANALAWGLGDIELDQQVTAVHYATPWMSPPGVSIFQGDLSGAVFVSGELAEGDTMTMCTRQAFFTAYMYLGRPYDEAAYNTFDLFTGRLDRSMDRCADDSRNPSGQIPILGDVRPPFEIEVGTQGSEGKLAAAVEISITYHPEEK